METQNSKGSQKGAGGSLRTVERPKSRRTIREYFRKISEVVHGIYFKISKGKEQGKIDTLFGKATNNT